MSGPLISHVMRRGVQAAQEHFNGIDPAQITKLQQDAELYEQHGKEINPMEFLPIVITGIVCLAIIASIRYTVGEVMASLAMIESPSTTAIIEPKAVYADDAPPAYSDNEKETLIPAEADADADVEITLINHKPITAKITTTIGHLQRVGGFRARWRGLGLSILYHGLHGATSNMLASVMGLGLCKAILLPTLVFAVAQQATFILPVAVAFALGLPNTQAEHVAAAAHHENCSKMVMLALRVLAVPATALFVALAVLLPASVTLTRVEAMLLPEDEETIVPFDKAAIMGELDLTVRGSSKALFVQAWRSFDRSARLRLIKLYAKMVLAQFTIAMVGLHLAIAELYIIGGERLALFFQSGVAQVKLMAIEAHAHQN
ncbi:hypothetical protein LTR22_022060 [Elasticomyces elasticus]|nr:hypothetical protein LTR22_022060 [Elasticomyces elasticus]